MKVKHGDVLTWERTFTEEDIARFAEISGDRGAHHMKRDDHGRLLAHGLLTATLPTKLGGDLDYIAKEMNFEFLRPVFAGDTIHCKMTITGVTPTEKQTKITAASLCTNQDGKVVLKGAFDGVIRHAAGG